MVSNAPEVVERVEVDPAKIATFTTEEDFVSLSVSLLVEVASYSRIAAATMGIARMEPGSCCSRREYGAPL